MVHVFGARCIRLRGVSMCFHRFHDWEYDDGRLSNFKATPVLHFQEVEQNYAGACVIQ